MNDVYLFFNVISRAKEKTNDFSLDDYLNLDFKKKHEIFFAKNVLSQKIYAKVALNCALKANKNNSTFRALISTKETILVDTTRIIRNAEEVIAVINPLADMMKSVLYPEGEPLKKEIEYVQHLQRENSSWRFKIFSANRQSENESFDSHVQDSLSQGNVKFKKE